MSQHADSDPVMISWSASSDPNFHGKRRFGWTWGAWRKLSFKEQNEEIRDFLFELVDINIEGDELA